MHKSRLGTFVIDCPADDVTEVARFWGAALGGELEYDDERRYAEIHLGGDVRVLVQAVDHSPRIHLDIESDEKEAEVARLEALGAQVSEHVKTWIIMEAPSGHRFCVINPQTVTFERNARSWNEATEG